MNRMQREEKLKADNLDLINSLEGEGYRIERLKARVEKLEAALAGMIAVNKDGYEGLECYSSAASS